MAHPSTRDGRVETVECVGETGKPPRRSGQQDGVPAGTSDTDLRARGGAGAHRRGQRRGLLLRPQHDRGMAGNAGECVHERERRHVRTQHARAHPAFGQGRAQHFQWQRMAFAAGAREDERCTAGGRCGGGAVQGRDEAPRQGVLDIDAPLAVELAIDDGGERGAAQSIPGLDHTVGAQMLFEQVAQGTGLQREGGVEQGRHIGERRCGPARDGRGVRRGGTGVDELEHSGEHGDIGLVVEPMPPGPVLAGSDPVTPVPAAQGRGRDAEPFGHCAHRKTDRFGRSRRAVSHEAIVPGRRHRDPAAPVVSSSTAKSRSAEMIRSMTRRVVRHPVRVVAPVPAVPALCASGLLVTRGMHRICIEYC